ncbi:DUF3499 family protein [Nitriliruptoraceae bacterium ZYF776]|nr:DUF3499 family protein [Profundirhabdus halotolerans]
MGEAGQLRRSTARDAVVRPLARAAERPCARPGCPAPARATLRFAYATAEAVLDRLTPEPDPQAYDLCVAHAERTDPPRGWKLTDQRPDDERDEPIVPPPASQHLGSEATVAVLAAALRAVPDAEVVARTDVPAPADAVAPAAPTDVAAAATTDAVDVEPPVVERDLAAEVTVELPRTRTPRPSLAAEDRGVLPRPPATDW